MFEETDPAPDLQAAAKRLETALTALEDRLDSMFDRLDGRRDFEAEADAMKQDRVRLASDLDAAKSRERELQRLADEASEVLGAAINEVRQALGKV